MRILITGISGFVGSHLAKHLRTRYPDAEIHGTVYTSAGDTQTATCHSIDLRQREAVAELIQKIQPEFIYHIAGQAFVPRSFVEPWETLENNIRAQLNIILACLELPQKPRVLVVTSAEIYGASTANTLPIDESQPINPTSPYSVSKVAQDMLALQYYLSHQLPIMRARPFNHIGPGQNQRFVAPAFALQIAQIEIGQQDPIIHVGNLAAQRDFTDVRDIVAAYDLIMQQGTPGNVYNIASGKAHSIQYLLDTLLSFVSIDIQVQVDPDRMRPVNIPILLGDATRLRTETGWQPKYSFERSLEDVLNDWRKRIQSSPDTPPSTS